MRDIEYCKKLLKGIIEEYESASFQTHQFRHLGAIEAVLLICEKIKPSIILPYKTKTIKYKKYYLFGEILEKEIKIESYKELLLRLANEFLNEKED